MRIFILILCCKGMYLVSLPMWYWWLLSFIRNTQRNSPVPILLWADDKTASNPQWLKRSAWIYLAVIATHIVYQYFSYFCWSYFYSISLVETLESYLALKTGEDAIELSAQQITSCTPNPMHCGGTGGCSGSIPEIGFTYSHMMGIVT